MKYTLFLLIPLFSCNAQTTDLTKSLEKTESETIMQSKNADSLKIQEFYVKNNENKTKSASIGSVSDGKLENGKIVPFYGPNFTYFDKDSYFASRSFTNEVVKTIVLDAYTQLVTQVPERRFYLMELSNREGGKIYPHRTHQNGLSVDFMMPKLQNGVPNYQLDTLGKDHYFLEFNNSGEYVKDTSIKVDFDLIAQHILILNDAAKKQGYSIDKVIIKMEYKDELFNTPHGKILAKSGIYITKNLTPIVNSIHDDHFHVDFKPIKSLK